MKNVLFAIFHKDGKDNANFELIKQTLSEFDTHIPTVDFYGNKWNETKSFFLQNKYDSLFVICSDVKVVCGPFIEKIFQYASDNTIGTFGFGTIHNCTFDWLRYDNIRLLKNVPFIEGYCLGVNRQVVEQLVCCNVYGYGIDVEIGYTAKALGLQTIIDNSVCISHTLGKSYNDAAASQEYKEFLRSKPDIHKYLNNLQIPTPLN